MPAGAPHKPPALVKVPVGLKLPRWLIDWMRTQDQSMAVLIEDALCKRHKLKPPNSNSTTDSGGSSQPAPMAHATKHSATAWPCQ